MALTESILSYTNAGYEAGDIKQKNISLAGVSALTELVPNTDLSTQVQILALEFGVDTAALFTIKSGSDVVMDVSSNYNGFPGLFSPHPERVLFAGTIGQNISVTPSTTITAGSVYVQYRLRVAR